MTGGSRPGEGDEPDRGDGGAGVRVGVDTGGTFTDVVVAEPDGTTTTLKTPSTPPDFEEGVLTGLREGLAAAGVAPGAVDFLSHGTTVGTNAVLEGELPPLALVTSEGLADVLAIGDQTRPALYDLQAQKAPPPVARRRRYGVPGRVDAAGEVVEPLGEGAVRTVAGALAGADPRPEAVVVSTPHSYLNPDHEERIGAVLEAAGLDPVLSSAVLPEAGEYDRTVTTALNAAVRGRVRAYLDALSAGVREAGVTAPVNVMHSGGGLFDAGEAGRLAVRTVLSGPAAGAVAVREVARREGYDDAVGMDMGGTSADVSVVRDGDLARTTEGSVGGYPLNAPTVDLSTVGEGGGSVVRVDAGGGLRVGPESAGADPGPACYGRGGDRPTLTDANLVLGRLDPAGFGAIELDPDRARAALEGVADDLGVGVRRAALSAVRVADAGLARELRRVTVERGEDPGGAALVAFGGAGPLQAAAVAREVGTAAVLVPPDPGVFSARGLLVADARADESRTYRGPLAAPDLAAVYADLEADLRARLDRQGFAPDRARVTRRADLRYVGQSYELTVAVGDGGDAPGGEGAEGESDDGEGVEGDPAGDGEGDDGDGDDGDAAGDGAGAGDGWDRPLTPADVRAAVDRFHDRHRQRYGHAMPGEPVEAVTLRVAGVVPTPSPGDGRAAGGAGEGGGETDPDRARLDCRGVVFEEGERTAGFYRRGALRAGDRLTGPAVVVEPSSTTLVPPRGSATVTPVGSLRVDTGEGD